MVDSLEDARFLVPGDVKPIRSPAAALAKLQQQAAERFVEANKKARTGKALPHAMRRRRKK